MLDKIHLATEEEVKAIADQSDFTPSTRVLKQGDVTAVWKVVHEMDPVFFGETSAATRIRFIYAISHFMTGAGATEMYFNVGVDDEGFQKTLEKLGAQRTSKGPEFRYRLNFI